MTATDLLYITAAKGEHMGMVLLTMLFGLKSR